MKPYFFVLILIVITFNMAAQGLTKNGQSAATSANFINKNGKIGSAPLLNKNGTVLILASLTTTNVSSLTLTTATGGGNITSDGGTTITERGVCWSTTASPTIAHNKTYDGTGSGSFISSISGLTFGSIYYVRAYAINSAGTAYGNQINFKAGIGANYQGGIIFYIDPGNLHGLIAASSDQSSGTSWGCYGTLIGTTSTGVGAGQANTTAIVSGCTTIGIAAQICNDLVLNGYSDWFLPSRDELALLYGQKNFVGEFTVPYYWNSSENGSNYAGGYIMSSGGYFYESKNNSYGVRAIRSF